MTIRKGRSFVVDRKSGADAEQDSSKAQFPPFKESDDVVVLEERRRARKNKPLTLRSDQQFDQIGELIGKELRLRYQDVLAQPIPDRLLDLLSQLEKATPSIAGEKKTSKEK